MSLSKITDTKSNEKNCINLGNKRSGCKLEIDLIIAKA